MTDPNDPDSDNDGLSDLGEFIHDTNPNLADSDSDGLSDGEEVNSGADGFITDPNDPDSDDDGLNDGDEFTHSTDPLNIDTDGDGYSDNDEVIAGTDPLDDQDYPGATTSPTLTETSSLNLITVISSIFIVSFFVIIFKKRKKIY